MGTYLMCYVGSSVADVAVHLAHDADMLVAVKQRVLVILDAVAAAVGSLVCFEAGIGEDNDQALGVLVGRGDGDCLLGDELRQLRWRK